MPECEICDKEARLRVFLHGEWFTLCAVCNDAVTGTLVLKLEQMEEFLSYTIRKTVPKLRI